MIGKILIIDGDDEIQRSLGSLLRASGFQTSSATDAISAMITVRKVNPDLVILELALPAGDGFNVLEQLAAHRPSDPLPVIVVTTRDAQASRQRALAAGAVAVFQKPASHDEILRAIRTHIGQKRAPRKRILIVEDDPDTQKGLATLLRAEGFVPHFAADGVSALSVAAREEPDVILLDLGLPAGDGFVVLDRLRKHATLSSVPVIVVSARDAEVNRPKALLAGAQDFFQKPADFDELLQSIRRAVGVA